jgi:diguanylate cyclase (GGDEF)-like protein
MGTVANYVIDALLLGIALTQMHAIPLAGSAQPLLIGACCMVALIRGGLLARLARSLRRQLPGGSDQWRESVEQIKQRDQSRAGVYAELHHRATHDELTGLANREFFNDRLRQAVHDARPFAVVVLDLDRFRIINDAVGHGGGDTILKLVARRLLSSTRAEDTVARAGGDDFLLLLRDVTSAEEVGRLTRHCLGSLSEPFLMRGRELQVRASCGVAHYPADADDAQALIARADEAMYQAKEAGRDTVRFFDSQLMQAGHERLQFTNDLSQALALGQFELLYQPKLDIVSERIRSVEALLRWNHPVRGRLTPDAFLALAEDSGLIQSIGSWTISEACRQAKLWQTQALPHLRVSVNICATQFRHPEFIAIVQEALRRCALHPSYLEIELTESALMADTTQSALVLEQLSRLGVGITIDDFGTGYSSMSCLQRFPIGRVKIDRSFIRHMQHNANDASVVRAIISLAHGLRFKVIAEGVESAEQLAILRRMGCDQYQGFYRSQAVPAADIELMIAAQSARAANDALAEPTVNRLARLVQRHH